MHLKKNWIRYIGIIPFVIILMKLDLSEIAEVFATIRTGYVCAALFLFIPLITVKAMRWKLLMEVQSIYYSLTDSITMYVAAIYVGVITPGRLGEFIKAFYLRQDGHPFGKALATVLLDKLFDYVPLLSFGVFGMLLFVNLFDEVVLTLGFILAGIIVVYFFKDSTKRVLKYISSVFVPEKYKKDTETFFSDLWNSVKALNAAQVVLMTGLTLVGWVIYFVMMFLFAQSISIDIPFLYLAVCVSISAAVTLIPVSIAGIGTRDVTLIILFSYLGYSKESAVAFSIMMLFMYVVYGLVGLGAWLKKPLNL